MCGVRRAAIHEWNAWVLRVVRGAQCAVRGVWDMSWGLVRDGMGWGGGIGLPRSSATRER